MCLTTRFKKEERTCACHCKTRIDLQRLSTRKFFSLTNLTLPTTTLCLCFVFCFTLVCYLLALPCNKYRLKFFSSSSFAIMTFCIHAYVWSLSLFIQLPLLIKILYSFSVLKVFYRTNKYTTLILL